MDHRLMLGWAVRNLDSLETAMLAFHQSDPYRLWGDEDEETGERRLRVRIVDASHPDEWAFQVGDIVHNLRVALDYVAFAHAVGRDGTIRENGVRRREVQFPICTKTENWSSLLGRLTWASSEMKTLFHALQPFQRPELNNLHPLTMLHALDNPHKHQTLIRAAPNVARVDFQLENAGEGRGVVVSRMGVEGQFKDGAVVARVRFQQPLDRSRPPIKVHFAVDFQVAFGDGCALPGYPVLPVLRGIADHLRDVVFPAVEPLI